MRIRGLKVWFPLRRGLGRELLGRAALWVRAVDGVSFDIRRGEVFCLVGESGCGKTTTGKALLHLNEATEGDILLEMPADRYARYEQLRTSAATPEETTEFDGLRRTYSLSWKEKVPWTAVQLTVLVAVLTAAFLVSFLLPVLIAGLLGDPFANQWLVLLLSIVTGVLLGAIGSAPPTRPYARTPIILALLALLSFNFIGGVTAVLLPGAVPEAPGDMLGGISAAWGESTFSMLLGVAFAPAIAGGVSRALISMRQERAGLLGIKMRTLRRRLHLIFQDPYESLNPKQSVFEIVAEPLQVNRVSSSPEEIASLVSKALEDSGLRPAEEFMYRFPHELSGGQRQRVSIAAALALEPDFIVADEPVSMLDVSIRTEIIRLMMELRKKRQLTYLFITHDLSLAWVLADRIAVMYLGKIVEQGTAEQVITRPKHPYTQALISVVPSPDPRHKASRTVLRGERPDAVEIPPGCRFHPRCPVAFERCGWTAEEVRDALTSLLQKELPGRTGAVTASDHHTVRIRSLGGAEELADSVRAIVPKHQDTLLALRGIKAISTSASDVVLSLHAWEEPQLTEVEPGNAVACHLVNAPPPQAVPLAVAPS